jgi:hypothetical protein
MKSERFREILHFLKFLILWIAGNLSIPFWMVGHVHLTMNVYDDLYEILASLGMNILVATGFFIEWRESRRR